MLPKNTRNNNNLINHFSSASCILIYKDILRQIFNYLILILLKVSFLFNCFIFIFSPQASNVIKSPNYRLPFLIPNLNFLYGSTLIIIGLLLVSPNNRRWLNERTQMNI